MSLFDGVTEAETKWRAAFERLKSALAGNRLVDEGVAEHEAWLAYRRALMAHLEVIAAQESR